MNFFFFFRSRFFRFVQTAQLVLMIVQTYTDSENGRQLTMTNGMSPSARPISNAMQIANGDHVCLRLGDNPMDRSLL